MTEAEIRERFEAWRRDGPPRTAFEEFVRSVGVPITRHENGGYGDRTLEFGWVCWAEATRQAAQLSKDLGGFTPPTSSD